MTERTIIYHEKRAKLIELLGGACANCGTMDRLEFDHIKRDRTSKKEMIRYLIKGRYGWDRLLQEIARCQLLCRNCHAIKSQHEIGHTAEHGTPSRYNNKGCRCDECRSAWAKYLFNWNKRRVIYGL